MATKSKSKSKKAVNGRRERTRRGVNAKTDKAIPPELQLDGNPVVGFRVPRGLLEQFDTRYGKDGRAALREMGIKWMQRAVNGGEL